MANTKNITLDQLQTSLTRVKSELDKKAASSHGTHLTLGTGSSNAFRGDYGNTAYQHSQSTHAPTNAQKNSDITKSEIEAKLTGDITSHTHSAYENQCAFSKVAVSGQTTVEAEAAADTLTLAAGSNITLTTDATNDKVTISATNTTYTSLKNPYSLTVQGNGTQSFTYDGSAAKTLNIKAGSNVNVSSDTSGNITISATDTTYSNMTAATSSAAGKAGLVPAPAAGKQGQYLRGDGTWATPTNTTYSEATTSAAGLMSAAMVTKLNGIATNANAYTLPEATSSALGGVKVGSNITVSSGTISLTKSNVTTALGYTPPTSDTNTTYTFATGDNNGTIKVTPSGGTASNISVKGLGSAAYTASSDYMPASHANTTHLTIGTGASNAAAGNHTHNYAGSSSAGGAANSVKTNLTIKLNGGSTEGTDLFTFNGGTAKTINITPSAIGAAASSHGTHLTIGTTSTTAAAGNHTHTVLTTTEVSTIVKNALGVTI